MRVICGLVIPTHGSVTIDGEQLGKELSFPRSLGMMIEKTWIFGILYRIAKFGNVGSNQKRIEEKKK